MPGATPHRGPRGREAGWANSDGCATSPGQHTILLLPLSQPTHASGLPRARAESNDAPQSRWRRWLPRVGVGAVGGRWCGCRLRHTSPRAPPPHPGSHSRDAGHRGSLPLIWLLGWRKRRGGGRAQGCRPCGPLLVPAYRAIGVFVELRPGLARGVLVGARLGRQGSVWVLVLQLVGIFVVVTGYRKGVGRKAEDRWVGILHLLFGLGCKRVGPADRLTLAAEVVWQGDAGRCQSVLQGFVKGVTRGCGPLQ